MAHQVPLSGFQDIDGVLWGGWRWDFTNLTYRFPSNPQIFLQAGYSSVNGFVGFNAAQQASATRALLEYGAVCGLSFSKVTTGVGNIQFGEATSINTGTGNQFPGGSAFAQVPDDTVVAPFAQGDTWYNHGYRTPGIGEFQSTAGIMHEIGHTLGLKHGHQPGGGGNNAVLSVNHDSQEYSVMTYRAFPGQATLGNGQFANAVDYPTSPMLDDIIALQWLYGPDYNYNHTNTTYTWNQVTGEMLVNGHHFNASDNVFGGVPSHHKIFMTVWDGGGVDTYNFGNFHTVVTVDLNPGGWSTPSSALRANLGSGHVARGSIANAFVFSGDLHGYIENAYGGTNNDSLGGNAVANLLRGNAGNDTLRGLGANDRLFGDAGNDRLTGGIGKDILTGGTGLDQFVFNSVAESTVAVTGRDVITDFRHGDKINLAGIDANALVASNQQFVLHSNFTHLAGEAQFDKLAATTFLVTLDTNGDAVANAAIIVTGVTSLSVVDFVL